MAQFKIYGDYGYNSETLLEEFDTLTEAERWVERYCGDGDFGGYGVIEIASFADSGEYVIHRRFDADDFRDETVWDDEDEEWSPYTADYNDPGSYHHW